MINFHEEAYLDAEGVWRWKSNDTVPFGDMLADNDIDQETIEKCNKVRDTELLDRLDKMLSELELPTIEERAEMRDNFDTSNVVNILTGKPITR